MRPMFADQLSAPSRARASGGGPNAMCGGCWTWTARGPQQLLTDSPWSPLLVLSEIAWLMGEVRGPHAWVAATAKSPQRASDHPSPPTR
jgi:hypothetical protein